MTLEYINSLGIIIFLHNKKIIISGLSKVNESLRKEIVSWVKINKSFLLLELTNLTNYTNKGHSSGFAGTNKR
jgi:hypothetical protein